MACEVRQSCKVDAVLKQPPLENILSFICSANNNVSRISQMVTNLCLHYGVKAGSLTPDTEGPIDFYYFPTLDRLQHDTLELELRQLGFGYRAKYIAKTCKILIEKSPLYFQQLRTMDYESCKKELLGLSGVGPKVADCIALFSMDKANAIPVDTHVWSIARKDYGLNVERLNGGTYRLVGDAFRNALGDHAGWAHSVLFTAQAKLGSSESRGGLPDVENSKKPTSKRKRVKVESIDLNY
jgi:N-glycosylase/DNA lyase